MMNDRGDISEDRMRILHYALGFPPYRTGGMTKFVMDLAQEQVKRGHETALLWPGKMEIAGKKVRIVRREAREGIYSFEIINPLPVPLDEGIKDIERFIKKADLEIYLCFLKKYKPDIVHIHSLMGLHREFVEASHILGIKTVFTSHDYFGICPKVTLFCNGTVCKPEENFCSVCNKTALSINKIKMMQSPCYRFLKDSKGVKWLRKRHRTSYYEQTKEGISLERASGDIELEKNKEYEKLREYYISILEQVDCMHYNSCLTREVYQKYVDNPSHCVIPITHKNISDKKKKKHFGNLLKIAYLAQPKVEKGYFWLLEVLDEIWEKHKDFRLNVYTEVKETRPYMIQHPAYSYEKLEDIMSDTDLVVVPSLWYETFGYTALEAMSYGVPVILSNHVGAKMLLNEQKEFIVEAGNKDELKCLIESLNKDILEKSNQYIVENVHIPLYSQMYERIMEIYMEMIIKRRDRE